MKTVPRFVGLDVHKNTITVAVAEGDRSASRFLGQFPSDVSRLLRELKKLGDPKNVTCCYEAGPTGFGLARRLRQEGFSCEVVAPALVPSKSGDRVKTDRRDAEKLAHFLRSGDLSSVNIPDEQTESIRDLERARDDAKQDETRARHRLGKFLLRHDRKWTGRTNWTKGHVEWIRSQTFAHEAQNQVLREYIRKLDLASEAVERLDQAIADAIKGWRLEPLVKDYQALRGVRLLTGTVIAAEVGNMNLFPTAKHFMSFVGLVPSENSSGDRLRRGSITKTGNKHLRRVLIEAAWSYRMKPRMSQAIKKRSLGVAPEIEAIAWKAQERLHRVYSKLMGRGRARNVVITAVARQLAGFIWAIGRKSLDLHQIAAA
jgi:transposase